MLCSNVWINLAKLAQFHSLCACEKLRFFVNVRNCFGRGARTRERRVMIHQSYVIVARIPDKQRITQFHSFSLSRATLPHSTSQIVRLDNEYFIECACKFSRKWHAYYGQIYECLLPIYLLSITPDRIEWQQWHNYQNQLCVDNAIYYMLFTNNFFLVRLCCCCHRDSSIQYRLSQFPCGSMDFGGRNQVHSSKMNICSTQNMLNASRKMA